MPRWAVRPRRSKPGGNIAPRERADILRKAYDLVDERTNALALLMTLEMGNPVSESKGEFDPGVRGPARACSWSVRKSDP